MGSNYYLKSDRDIFKKHYIKLIRHRPFGNDFYALYDVMLHESIDHNGELRNSETLPFDDDTLMMVAFGDCIIQPKDIKHFTSVVHEGLALFKDLGLIEIRDDGTIVMLKLPEKLGMTSSERVKRFRDKMKQDETLPKRYSNDNETQEPVTCNAQNCNDNDSNNSLEFIDKNKEIDKEKPLHPIIDKALSEALNYPFLKIVDFWNSRIADRKALKPDEPIMPTVQRHVSDARKKEIKARINDYTLDKVYLMIEKAVASDYLHGKNKDGWRASFDWCFTQTYFPKVLEDNYMNKGGITNAYTGKPAAKPEYQGHGTTV